MRTPVRPAARPAARGTRSERARLSKDALALAERVADGLGVAHARGMVHRDIKPRNLLLPGGDPRAVRILDFGLVRLLETELTRTRAVMGTPRYMAPEQARSARHVGPPADVYALGCVLYKCLSGRTAIEGDNPDVILAKTAVLRDPPRLRDVSAETPAPIDELVAHMMAFDPDERPADGAAAARLLREARAALEDDASGGAHPPAPVAITRREREPVSVILAEWLLSRTLTAPPTLAERRASDGSVDSSDEERPPFDHYEVVHARLRFAEVLERVGDRARAFTEIANALADARDDATSAQALTTPARHSQNTRRSETTYESLKH